MLVLSRKKGESVVVNGNITIVVVDVRGDKARIGIEAPADVAVYRSEVLAKSAAASGGNDGEAPNVGENEARRGARKAKNAGETQKRGKSRGARGAKKAADASVGEGGESAVEALYLSKESEAYRRFDAPESPELNGRSADGVASVELQPGETEKKTV